MYDALVSLAFNAASLEFRDWNNVTEKRNGREVKEPSEGLTFRCRKEEDMFNGYGYGE